MRVIELSNHPSTLLRQEREQLEREREQHREASERSFEEERERVAQTNAQAQAAYEVELARHEAEVQRLRDERDATLGWWRRLRSGSRVRKAERRAPRAPVPWREPTPPPPPSDRPLFTSRGAKLAAGIEGEELVANSLAEVLGEEWTLLRGYRNRRGEIDQLLLGPLGLVAIEVKHRNATVHVNGDEWRFERFDNYDNLVKEGLISDGSGRSPSQQLREPAGELEDFLARRGQPIAITPVVMLSHHRAKLGSYENLTVNIALDIDYIVDLIGRLDTALEPQRLAEIERLIVKDHEFHEKKRSRSGGRPSPPS